MTIYCWKCGIANEDGTAICKHCGEMLGRSPAAAVPRERLPNYLVWAILCTIFCCQPFGVVALVYSVISTTRADSGDYAGALRAAASAKRWCWISFWLGLAVAFLWIVIVVLNLGETILEATLGVR